MSERESERRASPSTEGGPATGDHASILLVDDGELDEVAGVLDAEAIPYERLRGGRIPAEIPPPRDLLIVTPRRVERVRRGAPADARPGRPLRIIAVEEDSPAMRRRLRRSGLHLLIRLPAAPDIWRLLIARALYRGSERRIDPRVAVGAPVAVVAGADPGDSAAQDATVLVDLSNRGCRLSTRAPLEVGDTIEFTLATDTGIPGGTSAGAKLTLRGEVRRAVPASSSDEDASEGRRVVAVVFAADLDETSRTRLTALINHWASGPEAFDTASLRDGPAIPACQLPTLPDLTLDDETDPPIAAAGEHSIELTRHGESDPRPSLPPEAVKEDETATERRAQRRASFEGAVVAAREDGPFVLIGRDLSAGGMRIERHPDLAIGDRIRLALHGPGPGKPFVLDARVTRDDGDAFGLVFDRIEQETIAALEKMIACLPDVESLEDGELAGLGAILSEILTRS